MTQSKRTWFLNGLTRVLDKHVVVLPNDDMALAKASTCKVEISTLKKERRREGSDTNESSNESKDDTRKRKKEKTKGKRNDTHEEINALRKELGGIALSNR